VIIFQEKLSAIKPYPPQEFANQRIAPDSSTAEAFARTIRQWTPQIKAAIERAPDYNEA
jgi:hypothetical protein